MNCNLVVVITGKTFSNNRENRNVEREGEREERTELISKVLRMRWKGENERRMGKTDRKLIEKIHEKRKLAEKEQEQGEGKRTRNNEGG